MTRQTGPQRSPLSPIRNHGGGGTAADAVGSSTKDKGWQQRRLGSMHRTSRMQPELQPDKMSKRVEGTVMAKAAAAAHLAPASRIPARSRSSGPTLQQQQQPAGGIHSRIPRPPVYGGATTTGAGGVAASPQPDYSAMLATPEAPPQLQEQQQWQQPSQSSGSKESVGPQGFATYSNPSYDGAHFLATPDYASPPSAGSSNARSSDAAEVFLSGLVEAEAAAGQLTPGLLEAAALTPATERSLEVWLRASPDTRNAAAPQPSALVARNIAAGAAPASTSAAGPGCSSIWGRVMPTPEAWQLLQHINDDSPAAAPKGVRGIMNAFLRTGPQVLSPEPSCVHVIRAPGVAAVPASGLLNVAGPGGVGVCGMVNAFLRTGANMLSPEPGMEAQQQALAQQQAAAATSLPLLHPYSPASPLAATPAGPRVATAVMPPASSAGDAVTASMPPHRPISPSSVGSNCEVGSSRPAGSISLGGGVPAAGSVPRLNLNHLGQQTSEVTEVSFGAALRAAGRADSPGSSELPTVRFFAEDSPGADAGRQRQDSGVAGVAAQRHRHQPPSPVTFCLPVNAPGQEAPQPASHALTFSFGIRAAGVVEDEGSGGGVEAAELAREQQVQQAGATVAAASAEPAAGGGAAAIEQAAEQVQQAALHRISSGDTVQQAHPFKAMLQHLQGPQYASPACCAFGLRPDSPQSPKECTPLHLISTSDACAASPGTVVVTPAPGQGSMTLWLDRRGMRGALSTPARNDLRTLWAAAHDIVLYKSEAAALLADNAALAEELEEAQAALRELGAEHDAAVVAAEAGALCAEAEVVRAQDAAGHMMQLADQIQCMFALCENEKEALVGELEAAQQQLATSEVAAVETGPLVDEQQAAQLQQQLGEARQAVAAAQQAAVAAQQQAGDAATELENIRRQLDEAQQQLASVRGVPELTPMAKLHCQLGSMHDSLAQLHAEQSAGRLPAGSPELDQLLEASRGQLAHVEQLLGGGDASTLRQQNERLHRCLVQARSLVAQNSPAPASGTALAHPSFDERRSPLPLALFGRDSSSEGEGGDTYSPATTVTLVGAGSPDVFSSPYLASHATLTVDYRDLHGSVCHQRQAGSAAAASQSPGTESSDEAAGPSSYSPAGTIGSPTGWDGGKDEPLGGNEWSTASVAYPCGEAGVVGKALEEGGQGGGEAEAEAEYTVVHNGMVITHVPASEVSKVQSMVQYWEAVASGAPLGGAHVSEEAAAEAEAYASAAVTAAEGAMAAREAEAVADAAATAWQQLEGEGEEEAVAEGQAAQPSPSPVLAPSPAATPGTSSRRLPAGEALTPYGASLPSTAAAGAATPARFTPLNFVSAPAPTPATGGSVDPQQAQQLHHLALGMAAAAAAASGTPAGCSPASAQLTSSWSDNTPAGMPMTSTVAVAVTPLALSALRARMSGSGGGLQDAVRSRLARLKADLQAAQAKLASVDRGLASIAFTPTSSIIASGTPGSRASSLQRRTPPTPCTVGALGSPIAGSSSGDAGASPPPLHQDLPLGSNSSRAAAMIAAGSFSPTALAVSQKNPGGDAAAAAPAAAAATTSVAAAPAAEVTAVDECTPPATRRSVRFADTVHADSSSQWAARRVGTPYPGAAAAVGTEDDDEAAGGAWHAQASASPVVASSRRRPLGCASGRGAGAPPLRIPLAAAQSVAKPAAMVRCFGLEWRGDDWGSGGGSSDDDSKLMFDASRMAQGANRAATPSPARRPAAAAASTPLAHHEHLGGYAVAEVGGGGSCATTTATSVLSTSSFSPPRPLVLLAVRPLGRAHRRGVLLRGGAGGGGSSGRRRSETDEREFWRRAAALNIQISPYFRRPRGVHGTGQGADAE